MVGGVEPLVILAYDDPANSPMQAQCNSDTVLVVGLTLSSIT